MYFLPPRLLSVVIQSVTAPVAWTGGGMGPGAPTDPWIGKPYRWTVGLAVVVQQHSSHLTPRIYTYDARDIVVGDWVADLFQGRAVRIVSITSATATAFTGVVEDVDRFNTFCDPTIFTAGNGGNGGVFNTGLGYVFSLNEEGLPILALMTSVATPLAQNPAWQQDQMARFQYRNYLKSFYRVNQVGHGFAGDEVLTLSSAGTYSKITSAAVPAPTIVGQVTSIGAPGPDWFTYRPIGRVVTQLTLSGQPGDLIYLGTTGLSNAATNAWTTPLYIKLDATTGIALPQSYAQAAVAGTGSGGSLTRTVTAAAPLPAITLSGNAGTLPGVLMGTVPPNQALSAITVIVNTAFSANAVLTVGTLATSDSVMPASLIDLTVTGTYIYNPSTEYTVPTDVYAFLSLNGSVTGAATVVVIHE